MNDPARPIVSVLTPAWNRAGHLSRVRAGLSAQTCGSFEWIVGNDGSDDDTVAVVHGFAQGTDFPLVLVDASVHVGKACIDNEMIKVARGELIVWCDSDDVLCRAAIATLIDAWRSIPERDRADYAGVAALVEAGEGALGCEDPDGSSADLPLNDLMAQTASDMVIAARAELLKSTPFLEVDYMIPESSVWYRIGSRKVRFVRRVLKTVSYGQANALSFANAMRYNRGRAHALGADYPHVRQRIGLVGEVRRGVNFVRYCVHGDIPAAQARRIWTGSALSSALLCLCFVPARIVAWNDVRRGVVDKTHIGFEQARKNARIDVRVIVGQ